MSHSTKCAACKSLRRRCPKDCVLAPYFPPTNPQRFACVHKIFGASNITKMLEVWPNIYIYIYIDTHIHVTSNNFSFINQLIQRYYVDIISYAYIEEGLIFQLVCRSLKSFLSYRNNYRDGVNDIFKMFLKGFFQHIHINKTITSIINMNVEHVLLSSFSLSL